MNWCRISINSGVKWLSEPPKLIIWNLNLQTLASFKKMLNQQFEIPGHCMSCIITWLILCRSMICMWQCVHCTYIYMYIHMICIDVHTIWISQIYTYIYNMILYMCTSCLSLGYYVCRPARAGRKHDMTVHPSPRCKCGCPEQTKQHNQQAVLKLNVHFRPDCPRFSPRSKAIFNRVSICDHCCATMPNVSGRVWNKKMQVPPRDIAAHHSSGHCLAKLPMMGECLPLCQIT